jgi:hypothetical protein
MLVDLTRNELNIAISALNFLAHYTRHYPRTKPTEERERLIGKLKARLERNEDE